MIYSLFPPHVGMRQYWRDFESLERWTRADPHRTWWKQFLQDTGGTGFWHELYLFAAALNLSTSASKNRSAFSDLPIHSLPKAAFS
jgi:hypothetical protein